MPSIFNLVRILLLGLVFGTLALADAFAAGGRVALLIGNQNYQNVSSLANPHSDIALMASALKEAGFDSVETVEDVNLRGLQLALRNFEDQADGADVALVYYSGHGMEMNGRNYMIPVDAVLKSDRDVEDETMELSRLQRSLEGARRLKLVILDACRDNPFSATMTRTIGTRSLGKGLAKVEPEAPNMLVAFASRAGTVALDGEGVNSPFALALAKYLVEPGLDIRIALGKVRDAVIELTNRQQEPFVYGSLGGSRVVLNIKEVNINLDGGSGQSTAAADWENIRDLADSELLSAFLERHGSDPVYRILAEKKMKMLEETQKTGSQRPDDIAWEAVRGSSDPSAYLRFLERYPNSAHRRAAELEVTALQPAAVAGQSALSPARRDCYLMAAEPGAVVGYSGVTFKRIDPQRALTACAQAVNENPDDGMLVDFLARAQDAGKSYEEAKLNYEKAAALGNMYAMTNLGWFYIYGTGVAPDGPRGRSLFEEAAKAGNPFAQNSLAWLYREGRGGLDKDPAQALKWYKQAAEQGFSLAMTALGHIYREGDGVDQNYVTSLNWYQKAAEAGDIDAMSALGFAYQNGLGAPKDYGVAKSWFEKAAQAGDAYAMASLGFLYDAGRGAKDDYKKQDYVQARYWYEKAAEAGNAYAMTNLARIYDKGFGIKPDAKEAARWAIGAIESGSDAQLQALLRTPDNFTVEFRQEIQRYLEGKGLYEGPIDGDFGTATLDALKNFGNAASK